MKTIGIIGGMSWQSSRDYYELINEEVAGRLGGFHSADLVLVSVDFAPIEQMQQRGDWEAAGAALVEAARRTEAAGAEVLILATNTMHKVAPAVAGAVSIPFIHIADATGRAIAATGLQTVGLLGTRYTMEQDFYRGWLESNYGIAVAIPEPDDRALINDVIFGELCLGVTNDDSKAQYRRIVERLVSDGAQGVILGCTEIGMLIGAEDSPVPVFDTTALHAQAAVAAALDGDRES
ncbi:MAG TPA: amino acid racemase [Actinobacteria bacterium]|nr:amino acid racemase [Actinomycetota bacterium]HDK45848.1 amino acid racemase [Actinomycetota bacterium]